MTTEEEILARLKPGCICKGIKLFKIQEAIDNGATSFKEVAKLTGIGDESCKSKRCGKIVAALLSKNK